MNDIIINKITTIKRCTKRIQQVYGDGDGDGDGSQFKQDFTLQDSVILNLQRCCEASIDIANHINRQQQLGIPQSSRDSFTLLAQNNVITQPLADNLKKMVGLRNIAVHDYQELNLDIVVHVVHHHLEDFEQFIEVIKADQRC
ncbi:type VII toxin-antitoxin system HepT family RNase toxin [Shewanella oncorhynchi]|uniref:type VII toxin-antitoxin system HepT family RNase toxin n=1 Tax=Shewanella oncorhynchi TaxID=2726434 RepID=UPI003D7921A8